MLFKLTFGNMRKGYLAAMNYAFLLNEKVLERPIVIYGAGALGMDCLVELLNLDVYVECFCDASQEKQKIHVLNKKVISPEELQNIKESHNVIVAVTAFKEVGELLEQQGIENLFYYKDTTAV